MNKFIEEQLNKITAPTSQWGNDTKIITFGRQGSKIIGRSDIDFEVGGKYHIRIKDYIINPPPDFTLSKNWNRGTIPPEVELHADCLQIMGKMLKFNCKGVTTNVVWEGWLPRASITIL